jgi:hypothetical protein
MDPKDAKTILRLQQLLKRNEEYRRMRPKEFNRQNRCAKLEMAIDVKYNEVLGEVVRPHSNDD